MKLAFSNVATMLTRRIVGTVFNIVQRDDPVFDRISPGSKPNENVTASWLYLLKIHIKRTL